MRNMATRRAQLGNELANGRKKNTHVVADKRGPQAEKEEAKLALAWAGKEKQRKNGLRRIGKSLGENKMGLG